VVNFYPASVYNGAFSVKALLGIDPEDTDHTVKLDGP
jgi:hypothetical protein